MALGNKTYYGNITNNGEKNFSVYDYGNLPEWVRIVEMIYLLVIMVLGVPGNGLLILVQSKNRNKSSTDYLVLTMAVLELLCSAFSTTLNICRNSVIIWRLVASDWLCKGYILITYQVSLASNYLLTALAIDRYIKTSSPWNSSYRIEHAKIICVSVVILTIVLSAPTLTAYSLDEDLNCGHNSTLMRTYQKILVIVSILMLVLTLVSYLKVGIAIRKRHVKRMNKKLVSMNISEGNLSRRSVPRFFKSKWPKRWKTTPISGASFECPKETNTNVKLAYTTDETSGNASLFCIANAYQNNIASVTSNNVDSSKEGDNIDDLKPGTNAPSQSDSSAYTLPQSSTITSGQTASTLILKKLKNDERLVNRTTRTLFLITFIYVLTFVLQWLLVLPADSVMGKITRYFSSTIGLINCITNPLFIFGMHSKFRTDVQKVLFGR